MKVLVLLHKDLVPPEKFDTSKEREDSEVKSEYDVVRALKKLGHKVEVLGVDSELKVIREAVERFKPKIVYNLLEEFAGEALFDQNVVSYLQMLKIPFTGCGPRGLILSRDKSLAKKIMTYHRIPTPKFQVAKKGKVPKKLKLEFPIFVKSLTEEASFGITQDSVVNNHEQLKGRIDYYHSKHGLDVILEEYIEGKEVYAALIGNESRLEVFPLRELSFGDIAETAPKIATSKVKWDEAYKSKYNIRTQYLTGLNDEVIQQIGRISKRAYKALNINGYARMDFRVHPERGPFLIEANPNPEIAADEDYALAAKKAGYSFEKLIDKFLRLGIKRN